MNDQLSKTQHQAGKQGVAGEEVAEGREPVQEGGYRKSQDHQRARRVAIGQMIISTFAEAELRSVHGPGPFQGIGVGAREAAQLAGLIPGTGIAFQPPVDGPVAGEQEVREPEPFGHQAGAQLHHDRSHFGVAGQDRTQEEQVAPALPFGAQHGSVPLGHSVAGELCKGGPVQGFASGGAARPQVATQQGQAHVVALPVAGEVFLPELVQVRGRAGQGLILPQGRPAAIVVDRVHHVAEQQFHHGVVEGHGPFGEHQPIAFLAFLSITVEHMGGVGREHGQQEQAGRHAGSAVKRREQHHRRQWPYHEHRIPDTRQMQHHQVDGDQQEQPDPCSPEGDGCRMAPYPGMGEQGPGTEQGAHARKGQPAVPVEALDMVQVQVHTAVVDDADQHAVRPCAECQQDRCPAPGLPGTLPVSWTAPEQVMCRGRQDQQQQGIDQQIPQRGQQCTRCEEGRIEEREPFQPRERSGHEHPPAQSGHRQHQ